MPNVTPGAKGDIDVLKLAIGLCAFALLAGCQTAQRGVREEVKIDVTPRSAKVTNSLGLECNNPCTLEVRRRKAFTVTASKPGYRSQTVTVKSVVNRKSARRTLASFVVPGGSALVAVDTISGAFKDHDPNPVFIRLKRR